MIYGQRTFGSGIFGEAEGESKRIISYEYSSNTLKIEVYGFPTFGDSLFGGRIEEENLATKTIRYFYHTLISKETNILYNWGIGIEKDKDILYSYKALIPFIGELPYRFTLTTSKTKDVPYGYTLWLGKEHEIPYAYKGSIARIRTIRYGYRSLKSLFEGTVRRITITATPKGQVAKIELERR